MPNVITRSIMVDRLKSVIEMCFISDDIISRRNDKRENRSRTVFREDNVRESGLPKLRIRNACICHIGISFASRTELDDVHNAAAGINDIHG
jgi:hypothetical protein